MLDTKSTQIEIHWKNTEIEEHIATVGGAPVEDQSLDPERAETREWARWNREMTRNSLEVAPPEDGHRKMVHDGGQRRTAAALDATALQSEREETGRTTSTSSSPRTRW
jgi:hypothetical protein